VDELLAHRDELYSAVFLFSLVTLLGWEYFWPRRSADGELAPRWKVNFSFFFINIALRLLITSMTVVALAMVVAERGIGLFNIVQVPFLLACVLGVLLMDLANYLQHLLLHKLPLLWRVHRMHHADIACDVTTVFRFHPLEMIVGTLTDVLVISLFGVPPVAVLLYTLARQLLSAAAHGNIYILPRLEAAMRWLVVTPEVHRIHHSQIIAEQNSNFSGGLLWWDYLFGTYLAQPAAGQLEMHIGLADYPPRTSNSVLRMLFDPFAGHQSRNVPG
jgi:sterol desaturase/sphingolipid hydroxylase (fatty acid hydroxylase superfamily)